MYKGWISIYDVKRINLIKTVQRETSRIHAVRGTPLQQGPGSGQGGLGGAKKVSMTVLGTILVVLPF